jgi:threonyl-tRNA synthetase
VYGPTERSSDEFLGDFHHGLLTRKIPILLVIGEKEQADGSVTVRRYGDEQQQTMAFDAFVAELSLEIRDRVIRHAPGI